MTRPRRIDDIRAELAAVDRDVIALVARRQELARAVGEIKSQEGRSLRDFAQEKEVLDRARRAASEAGVSPEVAERILRMLIQYALTVQERQRVRALGEGSGQRALVIGGAGQMGSWFVRFLASQGFEVEVADPRPPAAGVAHIADWRQSTLDHQLIVVAAPLGSTAGILRELGPRRPAGVVLDIGSLKSPLREALGGLVAAGVKVASIHPMFGPDVELLSGCHVILVDLGVPEANRVAESLFANTMAEVVPMDLDGHDRAIAYVLGLSHALNIAFFTALAESGDAAGDLIRLSSTTFDRQLAVAGPVAHENPRLYFEIQHLNRYGLESLAALSRASERIRSLVEAGREEEFAALMERGRCYLAAGRPAPHISQSGSSG